MLKCKLFSDFEAKVKRIETGPFRVIENGKEITITTVTNVIIEYKGNEVSVGSGFSLDQRKKYFKNPSLIKNKEITVKYFQESKDSTGKVSLRFPTIKAIFENGRDI